MAIARSGTAAASGSNTVSTSFTANLPTSVANGDIVLLAVATQAAGTAATISASGWTQNKASGETSGGGQLYLFWKLWSTGDPTTVSVAISGAGSAYSYVSSGYSGCNTTTPLGTAVANLDNTSDTSGLVTNITTTAANSWAIVCCGTQSGSVTFTAPTNYTTVASGSPGKTSNISDRGPLSSGTSTGANYTLSGASRSETIHVELFVASAAATSLLVPSRPARNTLIRL